jgi:hypothetical protein
MPTPDTHTRAPLGNPVRNQITRAWGTTKVVVAKRVKRFEVPEAPFFDEQSTEFFKGVIAETRNYLEYGSGGSSLLAHRSVQNLVSVESDRRFLRAVQRKLALQPLGAETVLIHVNIGLTEDWGKPVFTKATQRRLRRWKKYAQAPWAHCRNRNLEPDLILVDGRFRVACALESLLNLRAGNPCRILIDDYISRPHYNVIEEVADLIEMQGRMAVFQQTRNMDRERCKILVERHYSDYR